MADQDSGYKWWIRYVLVPMIGGGGIVGLIIAYMNLAHESPKLQPVAPTSRQQTVEPSPAPSPAVEPVPAQNPIAEVEALVSRWLAAFMSGNADEFVALSGEPFFFDKDIVLTKTDLRARYSALTDAKRENWRKIEILGIKVQTARELQQTGYDLSKDRVFGSMNLSLDDYAVTVKSRFENRTGGMLVVVRRKGNKLEIAGMWD